jgi:hypothetical protein
MEMNFWVPLKAEEFLEMGEYRLFKDSTPWSWLVDIRKLLVQNLKAHEGILDALTSKYLL